MHEPVDVVKAIMAGADAVQLVSTLLRHGPSRLAYLRAELEKWTKAHHYDSLAQFKGAAALVDHGDRPGFERADYLGVLQSWSADHLRLAD